MTNEDNNFYLQGNIAFNDRQKCVFEELDRLSSQKPSNRYSEDEMKFHSTKLTVDPDRKKMKAFRGKQSIFKHPEKPLKKGTKIDIPDFVKNPHKWKKYKLETEEMSDQSNKAVAMSFLNELKSRHDKMDADEKVEGPIKFNLHIKNDGESLAPVVDSEEKPSFVNGKYTMPEYVIGQKKKKQVRIKEKPTLAKTSVKLDHLFEEENE